MLSLRVDGSKIPETIKGGPKVCIKNTKTCFQPNPGQQLNLTKNVPTVPKFKVGANVTNLSGTLVLRNNGGDDLTITSNGTSYFSMPIAKGSPYDVSVFSQPAPQTCTITEPHSGNMGSENVVVSVNCVNTTPTLVSIAISPELTTVPLGLTQQYTAIGTYSDASTKNITASVSWSSSNLSVASINANGLATTLQQGDTSILASLGNVFSTEANLNVGPGQLVSIAITPADASIAKGLTQQYTAIGTYTDNSSQDLTTQVTWSSSASNIATISNTQGTEGLANATDTGSTNISADLTGITGSTTLTVTIPVHTVNVTVSIPTGTVKIANNGTNEQTVSSGLYQFSANEGATYDITATNAPSNQTCGVTDGSGTMGTTDVDVLVTCTVNLRTVKANVSGLNGAFGNLVLQNNGANDLTISSDGLYSFTPQVEEGGNYAVTVLTSPAHQTCSVEEPSSGTVPASNVTVNVNCTTIPPVLQSIQVTPSGATIATGETQQYTATGIYDYGGNQEITGSVTWASSDTNVATINSSGSAQGQSGGTTTISATLGGSSGSANLTVAPSVSLSVSGSPLLINLDFSQQGASSFLGSGNLVITNDSSITATNITADVSSLPGVLLDNTNCTSLIPGASCRLKFTLTTDTTHAPTPVTISGTNSSSVSAIISVARPWVTNGTVNAILPDPAHNVIYIGGSFTYVGPNTGNGVPIDSNGAALPSFPRVNGNIRAAISDGAGGWYIGGDFTQVGGEPRSNIAHILNDNTVDPNFNPNANGSVNALATNGSTVYAGGNFTSIGGQARNRIAALDGSTGTAITTWNPNASATVFALAINGSTVNAGGAFTVINSIFNNFFTIIPSP